MVTPNGGPRLPPAVLWDMDGTIVDTEPYWIAEETALAEEHGGTWSHEQGLTLVGLALDVSAGILVDRLGLAMTPAEVTERLIAGVVSRVLSRPPWRPGARELLADLAAAGVPMALVTMSYVPLADAVVSQLPAGTFTAVVTGDAVVHGKPHPEPYLTGAARVGVAPGRCVAVEDSPPGLASAEAAGCRSLGVQGHVAVPAAPGRSRVRSLTDVDPGVLAAIAAGAVVDTLGTAGAEPSAAASAGSAPAA
ncbi:MAG: HAD family hydrolase [Kineosporiaceae bacterium]